MVVGDVADSPGTIIETLTSEGVPTGNVYRIYREVWYDPNKVRVWKQYRQGLTIIHKSVPCRVLSEDGNTGEYGPW